MHAKDGVRLKLDEERAPVVIPLAPQGVQRERQNGERPGIQASELGLVAITLVLIGLLFALAHRVVQHPWVVASAPMPTMISQEIVLNPANKTAP